MDRQRSIPAILLPLAAIAAVLPIAIVVLLALGRLVGAMGDVSGQVALDWVALAIGAVWVVDLIALVVLQSLHTAISDRGGKSPQGNASEEDEGEG